VAAEGAGLPRAAEAEGVAEEEEEEGAELRGVVVEAAESPAVHHPWVAAVPR
jgi:hypothetical protein